MDLLTARGVVTDVSGRGALPDALVVDDAGRIAAVGSAHELAARWPSARRREHPDAYVVPGLVNAHVHLAFDESADIAAIRGETDDAVLLEKMARRARVLLDHGVTTARDVGDRGALAVALRDRIRSGDVAGPRVLAATAPLTRPRGHCWFLGGEVDTSGGTEKALREAVDRTAAQGADLVKVMASGGGTTEGGAAMWESQFDADELRVVVDQARRHGLPVAAHAHGTQSVEACARAGVATVEHCSWMTGAGMTSRDDAAPLARLLADEGVAVCPAHPNDWDLLARLAGPPAATEMLQRVRWLADQGVTLIPGTDAGLAPFADTTRALIRLGDWGFAPGEVLAMATRDAARVLGIDGETGELAVGKAADLLVVRGDPREDLAALEQIELVMAGGRATVSG